MRPGATDRGERGFTIIELLVAATILLTGLMATLAMVTNGYSKTALNRQRVGATNLGRELTEAARTVDYADLVPTAVNATAAISAIQSASSALGTGTSPWTIKRGPTTYTVTASVCIFDDPADQLEATPPTGACTAAAGTDPTTGDRNGDDFRRVRFTISWRYRTGVITTQQTALIVNPTGGIGPRITMPFPAAPATNPLAKVTPSTPGTQLTFGVTTTSSAALHWDLDDGSSGGSATGGPTAWTVSWDLGTPKTTYDGSWILDGTYSISAQPFDARNVAGDTKVVTVTINRSVPLAPTGVKGGINTRTDPNITELEWDLNKERDIVGYRAVYDTNGNGTLDSSDTMVCPTVSGTWLPNSATSCQDTVVHRPGKYFIVALDYDNATPPAPRQGAVTTISIAAAGTPPNPPSNLILGSYSPPTLSWNAPGSGSPLFYRIYRDGTTPADRIGQVTSPRTYADDGAGVAAHDYWVSAVDSNYNESPLVGPVRWPGG